MKVIICKWGILKFHPLLSFYVDWDWILNAIQNEPYIISIWIFKSLPKIFKNSYVLFSPGGINSKNDVKRMIKKLEQIENIELSEDKKNEIVTVAEKQLAL